MADSWKVCGHRRDNKGRVSTYVHASNQVEALRVVGEAWPACVFYEAMRVAASRCRPDVKWTPNPEYDRRQRRKCEARHAVYAQGPAQPTSGHDSSGFAAWLLRD